MPASHSSTCQATPPRPLDTPVRLPHSPHPTSNHPAHDASARVHHLASSVGEPLRHPSAPPTSHSTLTDQSEWRPVDRPCGKAISADNINPSSPTSPTSRRPARGARRQPCPHPTHQPVEKPPLHDPIDAPARLPRSPHPTSIPPRPLRQRSCVPPRQPHRRAAATSIALPALVPPHAHISNRAATSRHTLRQGPRTCSHQPSLASLSTRPHPTPHPLEQLCRDPSTHPPACPHLPHPTSLPSRPLRQRSCVQPRQPHRRIAATSIARPTLIPPHTDASSRAATSRQTLRQGPLSYQPHHRTTSPASRQPRPRRPARALPSPHSSTPRAAPPRPLNTPARLPLRRPTSIPSRPIHPRSCAPPRQPYRRAAATSLACPALNPPHTHGSGRWATSRQILRQGTLSF